ncbi:unnamed protein product [Diabrotica balteata]|uniref:Uncharacterized protein n=1 Tax=Diabrotica balteata TaxID=107213 RepID=A0A9N9XHC4_DIABA|nr:unnamed protein product [Diabrotica balteata]
MPTRGETTSPTEGFEATSILHTTTKPARRKRMERSMNNNGSISTAISAQADFILHNNNNLKNERLSPITPDTSSRSRSITPSSSSHPDTPPTQENPMLAGRNYSDFMRSLAAKYNNTNPNDYFNAARNGFPPPIDPRFKPAFPSLLPITPQNKENDASNKRPDFSVMNPFSNVTGAAMFPPLIDMSSTQTLMALVKTAKEAELQGLLKNIKRPESSSPLDLSAAAPPAKRPRTKTPLGGSPRSSPTGAGCSVTRIPKRSESESPKLHEDISNWSVDDVCNFISSIDICAEYTQLRYPEYVQDTDPQAVRLADILFPGDGFQRNLRSNSKNRYQGKRGSKCFFNASNLKALEAVGQADQRRLN